MNLDSTDSVVGARVCLNGAGEGMNGRGRDEIFSAVWLLREDECEGRQLERMALKNEL